MFQTMPYGGDDLSRQSSALLGFRGAFLVMNVNVYNFDPKIHESSSDWIIAPLAMENIVARIVLQGSIQEYNIKLPYRIGYLPCTFS